MERLPLTCVAIALAIGAATSSSPVLAQTPPQPGVERALGLSVKPPLGDDPDATLQRRRDLDAAAAAGFRVIRTDFLWHRIEASQGVFDFSGYDRLVDDAAARGIEVLALLCYGVPWATSWGFLGDTRFPPDDPADFGAFAGAVAQHFRGRVRRYEVWNEPNHPWFWPLSLGGDATKYGELLRSASAAIRAADPAAEVAFGGTFYQEFFPMPGTLAFTEATFQAHPNLAASFDAFAYHPYRYPFTTPEAPAALGGPGPLETTAIRVRDVLSRHGAANAPLWITETGWHTAPLSLPFVGVSEHDQARYLVRATLTALAQGVELFVWFELRDGPLWDVWQEHAFGLLAYDPDLLDAVPARRKPAYTAHLTLATLLGGLAFQADLGAPLGLGPDARALRFGDGSQSVTALWATSSAAVGTRVQLPLAGSATVVQMDGTATPAATIPTPTGLAVPISLTQDPVYVVQP